MLPGRQVRHPGDLKPTGQVFGIWKQIAIYGIKETSPYLGIA